MWMQRASRVERWNHTSHLLAMIHNACPNATVMKQPWQFHPWDGRGGRLPKGEITDLIALLPKEQRPAAREAARQARERKKARGG